MAMTSAVPPPEEREEGEIVEDDFEDVSDCSMSPGSPPSCGKSVSPPGLLRGICLSSVSSHECSPVNDRSRLHGERGAQHSPTETQRPLLRRKHRAERHAPKRKHRRKSRGAPLTDSEDESVDPKYIKKLRIAVHKEAPEDSLQNNLRSRLKVFIDTSSQSDDEANLTKLRDLALLSTLNNKRAAELEGDIDLTKNEQDNTKMEDENNSIKISDNCDINPEEIGNNDHNISENLDDSELRELRIAALKSFFIRNHNRRKRSKALNNLKEKSTCDVGNKKDVSDVDKENDQSMINNDANSKLNTETFEEASAKVDNAPLKNNGVECTDNLEDDVDVLRAMLLASVSKQLASKTSDTESAKSLQIPDIRKVEKSKTNRSSLSITVMKPKPFSRTIKNDLYTIRNANVNLKNPEQMRISNVVVKPLIINVNGDSDSEPENDFNGDEGDKALKDTVTEFLKKQRAEVEAAAFAKEAAETSLKSDDLLLEKSVVKLLPRSQQLEYRRLKQLLARKKSRLRKYSQTAKPVVAVKKVPKMKPDCISDSSNTNANGKVGKSVAEKKNLQPADNLQRTLSDIQIRKNGRLQMKGKYRSLAPLLHKINQTSNERRQHEIEIKRLLLQIQRERTKLAASHQSFTALVQQLLREKVAIDQRFSLFKISKQPQVKPATSTPNKFVKVVPAPVEAAKNENAVENNPTKTDNCNNAIEVCNKEKESTLLDPNDITKVFVEEAVVESATFPKYTSPLDSRDTISDPLTMVCPYDLLGVCKDKECRYMHCS